MSNPFFLIHSAALSLRGDATNAQTIAIYLKKFFNINSIIAAPAEAQDNNVMRINEMKARGLDVRLYASLRNLQEMGSSEGVTHTYLFLNGQFQNVWVPKSKHLVHAVFNYYEPHGDVYAYVSKWLYRKAIKQKKSRSLDEIERVRRETLSPLTVGVDTPTTWVSHTVSPLQSEPGVFRRKYKIPDEAKLIVRIGGYNQFDDIAAMRGVEILLENK